MRVKFVYAVRMKTFESEINKAIEELEKSGKNVIDVKLMGGADKYAMIMYK